MSVEAEEMQRRFEYPTSWVGKALYGGALIVLGLGLGIGIILQGRTFAGALIAITWPALVAFLLLIVLLMNSACVVSGEWVSRELFGVEWKRAPWERVGRVRIAKISDYASRKIINAYFIDLKSDHSDDYSWSFGMSFNENLPQATDLLDQVHQRANVASVPLPSEKQSYR